MIGNNIHLVVARVVFVDFARLHRSAVPLRDRYLRTLEIMTATLWPAFAGLGVFARPFTPSSCRKEPPKMLMAAMVMESAMEMQALTVNAVVLTSG